MSLAIRDHVTLATAGRISLCMYRLTRAKKLWVYPKFRFKPSSNRIYLHRISALQGCIQRVCSTSREKRTSKPGSYQYNIKTSQYWMSEKGCIFGRYVARGKQTEISEQPPAALRKAWNIYFYFYPWALTGQHCCVWCRISTPAVQCCGVCLSEYTIVYEHTDGMPNSWSKALNLYPNDVFSSAQRDAI